MMSNNTASPVDRRTCEVEAGADAVAHWQAYLRSALDPRIEVVADRGLRARAARHTYGETLCIEITGTPHALRFAPVDKVARVLVSYRGEAHAAQHAREAQLPDNTFCLLDGAPATLTLPTRAILLQMPAQLLHDHLPAWDTLLACAMPNNGATAVFAQFLRSICRHAGTLDEASRSEAADTLQRLLVCALRAASPCQEALPSQIEQYHKERIRAFVKAQLRDPNLSVEMIAQAIGLSARYVHRLFSNESVPLMRSVWDERLNCCHRDLGLVALRNRSVSEIAFFWGFNNPAHFSRAFRLRFGMSPTAYRQRTVLENAGLPSPAASHPHHAHTA